MKNRRYVCIIRHVFFHVEQFCVAENATLLQGAMDMDVFEKDRNIHANGNR